MNEMKKSLIVVFLAAAAMLSGCGKNGNVDEPGIICGQYTRISNMIPGIGCASEDESAMYFAVLDDESLDLVRQDKTTGERLVLDSIEKPADSNVDFSYQYISVYGDHVYYMPFDTSDPDGREYKIWRVGKDGSGKTMISAPDDELIEYYILDGSLYYRYLYASQGVWSCEPDGSGAEHLLDKSMNYPVLYSGRYYYTVYDFSGGDMTVRLCSCLEDGSDERVLLETGNNFSFALSDDGRICLASSGESSWEILSVNVDGSGLQTLAQGLPSVSCINSLGGDVYFSCSGGNASFSAGLYRLSGGEIRCLVSAKVVNFALLDGGSIIYMNADDTSCGRLGASYMTDINGSFDRKL